MKTRGPRWRKTDHRGEYSSLADFAQELTEETTDIPENLQYYIDYECMGRDLEINDVLAVETGVEDILATIAAPI